LAQRRHVAEGDQQTLAEPDRPELEPRVVVVQLELEGLAVGARRRRVEQPGPDVLGDGPVAGRVGVNAAEPHGGPRGVLLGDERRDAVGELLEGPCQHGRARSEQLLQLDRHEAPSAASRGRAYTRAIM